MDVTSLGYRTDLMLRALEGSEVTDHGDHIVVRSPASPSFWWGNFLLLAAPPPPRQAAKWLARFAEVFPSADHVALGIEATEPGAADRSGLAEAGLRIERNAVLVATRVSAPPRPGREIRCRPLAGDADWQRSLELRLACDEGTGPAATRAFYEQRTADARRMAERGHGEWFGAFAGDRLVAQLGVFASGCLARYQNVETHPDWRRRGLAGTLVWQAGQYALARPGVRALVIVADPAGAAIRVYRSVGFADVEAQIGFEGAAPARPWP